MYNVGLTGNVAAGKSTVSALMASWGATVIDADEIVRELQAPGQPVFEAIVDRFGRGVVNDEGALDRSALRRLILNNDHDREALNALVHPAVAHKRELAQEQARRTGARIVINAIPLLFEVMSPGDFDGVLLVDAPEALRRTRLMTIRDLSEAEANALMRAQMPAAEKRPRATWILDNTGTVQDLETAARTVWDDIGQRGSGSA